MWTLISATPSPYARKVRIALQEKGITNWQLQTEVPWDSTTQTPQYNPLEKLPVLILNDGTSIYESSYILEWLEAKHPEQPLLPSDIDQRLFAKKIAVVADGICDALLLAFFERLREPDKQSEPWKARQMRKVDGGIAALASWASEAKPSHYLVGDKLSLADISAGSVLGYMAVRFPEHPWKERHPELREYAERLETRESFATTRPSPQTMRDKVV
ncbi:hypothetical protein MBLNU230_g0391t1 [Neophaeotheca triangularis]